MYFLLASLSIMCNKYIFSKLINYRKLLILNYSWPTKMAISYTSTSCHMHYVYTYINTILYSFQSLQYHKHSSTSSIFFPTGYFGTAWWLKQMDIFTRFPDIWNWIISCVSPLQINDAGMNILVPKSFYKPLIYILRINS